MQLTVNRRAVILVLEDAIGVSDGYKGIWRSLLDRSGLRENLTRVVTRSAYRAFSKGRILEWRKTRKQPGFSSDSRVQSDLVTWLGQAVESAAPDVIVCMDPALLFLFNDDWNQATLDVLRGGVYFFRGIPVVISLPVTAWNQKAKVKDIAKLNDGFTEKGDFEEYRQREEDDEDDDELDGENDSMEWHEPVVVPYGRIVLEWDFAKAFRICMRKLRCESEPDYITAAGRYRSRERLVVRSEADCDLAYRTLRDSPIYGVDIETIPFQKKKKNQDAFAMTVVSYTAILSDSSLMSFAFTLTSSKSLATEMPAKWLLYYNTIKAINDLPNRACLQNGVYDCMWFIYYDLPLRNYAYDSMSLWWSRFPDLPRRLDFISSMLLDDYRYWKANRKLDDFIEYCNYAMDDTEATLRNTLILIDMASKDDKMRNNFFDAHSRSLAALGMSAKGLAVDESVMSEIAKQLESEAKEKLDSLRYIIADPDFNPNSAPQKKFLIYTLMKAKYRNAKGRFVKREDDASTGAVVLRAIRADHPVFRRIANAVIDAGTPAKQISNVVGIQRHPSGSTGSRFLTSYDGVGTTTSRLSSRAHAWGFGGNAQNIRKKYRRFGKADNGHFLLEIDLSASDDVFVAFESREPKKIELVRSGKDTHATNALIFFADWTYDRIVAGKAADDPLVVHPITGVRQITKKVVHGTHYLMAGLTLLNSAGREAIVAAALQNGFEDAGKWTQEKLVEFCDMLSHRFRLHYPRFQLEDDSPHSWYRELRQEVVRDGGFLTPFNYFQRFSSDPRDDSTLRAVAATAGQAGTAGRINMVLDELTFGLIPKRFRDGDNPSFGDQPCIVNESSHGVSVRLQTHDSITFDINPSHPRWIQGLNRVFRSFKRSVVIYGEEFVVGIEADASIHWAGKEGVGIKRPVDLFMLGEDNKNWLDRVGLTYYVPSDSELEEI